MQAKLLLLAALAAATLALAGCQGAKETEDEAFITVMGIDEAADGKYKFTYVIEIPRAVGNTQGPGLETGEPTVQITLAATTPGEARNLLSTTLSRFSNISHLKAVILGEAVARKGVMCIIAPHTRYREYRGGIFVLVAKGTAENFLTKNKPKIDYLPSKYFESMMMSADESQYYLRCDIHSFYLGLKNPGRSACAGYVAINPLIGADIPAGPRPAAAAADTYVAGGIPRTGTMDPAEFAGLAVFSGDRMTGVLPTRATRTLALLENKFVNKYMAVSDPVQPARTVNLIIRNARRPDIAVELADGQERIRIAVLLEGDISSNPGGINYEADGYREQLESRISELVTGEIENFVRRTQALGSDVFGFGRYLRGGFRRYDDMKNVNFDELYRTAVVEVKVTTKIRRSGLMLRTSPTKPTADGG